MTEGNVAVEEGLIYRILPPDEWHRLEPIFKVLDWFLPPEYLATASVVENQQGDIVSVHMLQLVLHAEPRYTDPNYVGKVNYLRQTAMLENLPKEKKDNLVLPGFLVIAPDEMTEQMLKLAGFTKQPGTVWRKDWKKEEG